MSDDRTIPFRRNELLEMLLTELNRELQPSENQLLEKYMSITGLPYPVILVLGPLRSGTTLFMQWLANTGLAAYPTNLLSRFYQAPIIGAKIQLMLADSRYNFRDELGKVIQKASYTSENGKTKGMLAPNEFWYFWRRFLSDPSRDVWTNDELRQSMDVRRMIAELSGIMEVFEKPFAAKAMLFNYNISFLDSIFDNVLFVQLKRDPVANVASVLEARKRQFGSADTWYSFKIPEYDELIKHDPVTQVAGQVHYINHAVSEGLLNVTDNRKLVVDYEKFCADPSKVFASLRERIGAKETSYNGPESFKMTRDRGKIDATIITAALNKFNHP